MLCYILIIFSTQKNIQLPFYAHIVHIHLEICTTNQFAIALAAHLLCALHLQTSHDNPCDVTEIHNFRIFGIHKFLFMYKSFKKVSINVNQLT